MRLVKIVLGFDRQVLLSPAFCSRIMIATSLGIFTSRRRARRARTGCKRAGWRLGPAQNGSDRAIPPLAPRSCPIGPCRRKYDLSRAGLGSVPGRPVGSRGDPAALPSFPGIAGWLAAAVPAALSFGTVSRSSDAPGSRNCRCRTPTRSRASGKSTAVRPLLWPSHPSRVWTTALSWNSGCAVVVPSNRGRHVENPDR